MGDMEELAESVVGLVGKVWGLGVEGVEEEGLEDVFGRFGDGGAGGVGRGVAEGALVIFEDDLALQVDGVFADAFVEIRFIAHVDGDVTVEAVDIVEAETDLEFQGEEVGEVYEGVDPGEVVLVFEAAPQGFRRGAGFGGIDMKIPVQPAGKGKSRGQLS